MDRRRFVGLVTGGLGTLAGCSAPTSRESGDRAGLERGPPAAAVGDVDLPVPASALDWRLARDAIPAIVEPATAADWGEVTDDDGATVRLPADAPVVGVERGGRARAYPLRILDWHEVANDSLGGPIAVTYCVLCGSSVVVERRVAGEPTVFGVSGALWRDDLVLYDRATESLWSQLVATAIRGPRTGDRLRILPSTLTTWAGWRDAHPGTDVLLPPPHSNTVRGREQTFDYATPKYSYDDEAQLVGYDAETGESRTRELVVGVVSGGEARAYPFAAVRDAGVVEETVGDLPVVVTVTPESTLVAYDRRVDGQARSFAAAGAAHLRAAGSRWDRATGRAVDGRFADARLDRANDHPPMFWRGWSNFNPETTRYGTESG